MKGIAFVKNTLGNLLDKDKKAFNQLTHDYKIRICNRNNLVVYAIKEENSMIILPTEVSVGDVVVDERSNKFYISKTEEISNFEITMNGEKKEIGVVKLIFDNAVLSKMTISNYVQSNNSINTNITVTGNEAGSITIDAGRNTISVKIDLEIREYWKLLRNELAYSYNNSDFKPYIEEVDEAFEQKRPIDESIAKKAASKALTSIRNFIIDFGAKFLAEYLSKLNNQ